MKKFLFCFLFLFALITLAGCSKSINLNDYASINVEGYEGYGEAELEFDTEKFVSDLIDQKIVENNSIGEELANYFTSQGKLYSDNNGYLNNGDTVVYKWGLDDEKLSSYLKKNNIGLKTKYDDLTYKVDNMKKVTIIDMKDVVNDSKFYGVNGTSGKYLDFELNLQNVVDNYKFKRLSDNYSLVLKKDGWKCVVYFNAIKLDGKNFREDLGDKYYSNGSDILIQFDINYDMTNDDLMKRFEDADSFTRITGYKFDNLEFTHTISGLYDQLENLDDISEEQLQTLLKKFEAQDDPYFDDKPQITNCELFVYDGVNRDKYYLCDSRKYSNILFLDFENDSYHHYNTDYRRFYIFNVAVDENGDLIAYPYAGWNSKKKSFTNRINFEYTTYRADD